MDELKWLSKPKTTQDALLEMLAAKTFTRMSQSVRHCMRTTSSLPVLKNELLQLRTDVLTPSHTRRLYSFPGHQ